MTPGQRLAKEVRTRIKLPGARFDDLLGLCEQVLRKPPRSPARRWKPETDTKPARRQKHREETARIRDARMKIAGGRCEAVEPLPFGGDYRCPDAAEHMHHQRGGSGRRRQEQSVENVRMLCAFHHREAHRAAHPGADQPKQQEE